MKKKRIDSHTGEGEIFRAKKPDPPSHLQECDLQFWDKIVSARDFTSRTAIDLEHAANLAQTLADIRSLQSDIRKEGLIVDGKKNPKHDMLDTLVKRSLALSRSIQVHAMATVGESRHMKKRNQKQKEVIEDRQSYDNDSLIPGLIQ